jgi:hypothetical protein
MSAFIGILSDHLRRAIARIDWDYDKAGHGCTDAYCAYCDKGQSVKDFDRKEALRVLALARPALESTLTWYTDPGHAWLRVHRDVLAVHGFSESDFSCFSYVDQYGFLYLEEDSDASQFLDAIDPARAIHFEEARTETDSHVRDLPRLNGARHA